MWAGSEISGKIDKSVGMTFNTGDFTGIVDRNRNGGADGSRTHDS